MANLSFRELKDRVTVIDVANYLGYTLDKSKGLKQPSFVLRADGAEVDRIYVKNPETPSTQGYWRRGATKGGDVITFVRDNIDKFNVLGYNEVDKLNKVLHQFANHEYVSESQVTNKQIYKQRPFEQERWIKIDNSYYRDRILESRGIDRYSSTAFADHIDIIRDGKSASKYINIGFPYTKPGDDKVIGYEIRGIGGFKSKASGSDSTNGMWIADFTRTPLEARNLYIAESSFDAISYYQLHRNQIDLFSSVFVSFGGAFSDKQFSSLIEYYDLAQRNLLFDNDLYGRIYDMRAYALVTNQPLTIVPNVREDKVKVIIGGKDLELANQEVCLDSVLRKANQQFSPGAVTIIKPQSEVKDWNEILQLEPSTPNKCIIAR